MLLSTVKLRQNKQIIYTDIIYLISVGPTSLPKTSDVTKYGPNSSWCHCQTEAFVLRVPIRTNDGRKHVEQLCALRQQDGRDIHHSDHLDPQNCRSDEQYQRVALGQRRMGSLASQRRYQVQREEQ